MAELTSSEIDRVIQINFPGAVWELGKDDAGLPFISEWSSDLHPDQPTVEELQFLSSKTLDPTQPDWPLAFERVAKSQVANGLFAEMIKHPDLAIYTTLFMFFLHQGLTDMAIGLFKTVLGLAASRGLKMDAATIGAWNELCVESQLPPDYHITAGE